MPESGLAAWPLPVREAKACVSRWTARLLDDPLASPLTVPLLVLAALLAGVAVALAETAALLVVTALLAWIFILSDFRIGVWLLVLVMPLSASSLFPHNLGGVTGLNPLNLLLLGTFVACLMRRPLAGERLLSPRLLWCYVTPMAFAAMLGFGHVDAIPAYFRAATLVSFDGGFGYLRDMLIRPLFLVLFALMVAAAAARARRLESLLLPMLLAVWLMGLTTLAFVYFSGASLWQLADNRARGFFSPLGMHANDLGRCYATVYALMLFTFAASRDLRLRMILLASMGMVVLALMLTFSRGAFLGFVIVNVLFLVSRRRFLPLFAGALMLAGLVMVLPGAVYERIAMGWDHGLNTISAGRVDDIWIPLLPVIGNSPIFGHGLGSILWSPPMRIGAILEVTHPHNAWLQALLDMGVLGLLLVTAYWLHVWRGFRALARDAALTPERRGFYEGAAVGLVAFMITAFAGSSLLPVSEQTFLWFAIGMMIGEQSRATEAARHA